MRLQTEALADTTLLSWVIVLGAVAAVCCAVVLFNSRTSSGQRLVFGLMLVFNTALMVSNFNALAGTVPVEEHLGRDLKSQLGIEKVSYDEEYRAFTGEKDGKVVSCVLFEEGDRGDVYEVICK